MSKKHYCRTCDEYFHPMGIARHRAMHRDKGEDCKISTPQGIEYTCRFSNHPRYGV